MRVIPVLSIAISAAASLHTDDAIAESTIIIPSTAVALDYRTEVVDCLTATTFANAVATRVSSAHSALSSLRVRVHAVDGEVVGDVEPNVGTPRIFRRRTCDAIEQLMIDAAAELIDPSAALRRPDPQRVTLHMRAVDGRAHLLKRVVGTTIVYGRRGQSFEVELTEPLCTTPCSAEVPQGPLLVQIFDEDHRDHLTRSAVALNETTLDISYLSHGPERDHAFHRTIWGLALGAVTGYAASAALASHYGVGDWHFATLDFDAACVTMVIGGVIGYFVSDHDNSDQADIAITTASQAND